MKKSKIEFTTILKPYIEDFILYRKAENQWTYAYYGQLYRFDKYCSLQGLSDWTQYQSILNGWAAEKDSETQNSCRSRQDLIISLTNFINSCRGTSYKIVQRPKKSRTRRVPHNFSKNELTEFFHQCDSIIITNHSLDKMLRKITVPVYFRLLYSTGMRVNEARWLLRKDVHLDDGHIIIRKSKGSDQHLVVMHESMLELMRRFDETEDHLIPNRKYFFQSSKNSFYSESWVQNNFHRIWEKVSSEPAVAYDFRHLYATDNINQWIGNGFDFLDKLFYLSKSMGHSTIESTKYYYSLIPALSDTIQTISDENFSDLLPKEARL